MRHAAGFCIPFCSFPPLLSSILYRLDCVSVCKGEGAAGLGVMAEVPKRQVNIKSTHTVAPAQPTARPRTHYLSNIDLLYSNYFIHNVYYFRHLRHDSDPGVLIQALKSSLAKVLVHYPPLAGRARPGEDGRLYIDCNDEGVLLVEAATDASFDEWKHPKDCPLEQDLNIGDSFITDHSTTPLLRIQVTLFRCGGVSIGIGFAHLCMDGGGATDFMKSWSETHRSLPISNPPLFVTHLLKPRSPPSVRQHVKDLSFIPKVPSPSPPAAPPSSPAKKAVSTFYFSADAVDAVVQEVQNGPWSYDRPTSFEALAALCWKAMTEARDLADDTISTYCYPINVRSAGRWDPALPAGFFGNGPHSSCLAIKAGDIRRNHLSYVARKIREDKEASGLEYFRSLVDLLEIEVQMQGKSVEFHTAVDAGTDVQGTTFASFPAYQVDFGSGKPLYFSYYPHPAFGDGLAFILPAPAGGRSTYVAMSMAEQPMKKLLEDDIFGSILSSVQACIEC